MFFIIVMVIFWVIELTGAATLLYFRKEPCIAVRDLSMNISCSILLLCMYSLIASVFEPYFAGEEWLSRCPLLYWTFVFATPATSLPIVIRAYNFQFKFHKNRTKITDENDPFFDKCAFTTRTRWSFLFFGIGYVICLIPAIILEFSVPRDLSVVTTLDQCFGYHLYIFFYQIVPISCAIIFLVYKYRILRDPYYVKLEFVLIIVLGLPPMSVFMLGQLVDAAMGYTAFSSSFQPITMNYITVGSFIMITNWVPMVCLYLEKKKRQKIQESKRIEEQSLGIKAIFESPFLTKAFLKVTLDNWCVEPTLFAMAVEKYVHYPEEQLLGQAKVIYKRFIEKGAELEINIDHQIYLSIHTSIEKGTVTRNLFNPALKDVFSQLEGVLMKWKKQPSYQRIIEEYEEESLREKIEMFDLSSTDSKK